MPSLRKMVARTVGMVSPAAGMNLRLKNWERTMRRRLERTGMLAVHEKYIAANGPAVLEGPFAGLVYPSSPVCTKLACKLCGSYEREIRPWIEAAVSGGGGGGGYRHVIDIGCAEGLYVVGLARAIPAATVDAYDLNELEQERCRRLARLNGVEARVRVHGRCDHDTLRRIVTPDTLLFCDCEGGEGELLDPSAVPELAGCDLIVELHDLLVAGLSELLEGRFRATHDITWTPTVPRDTAEFPGLTSLSPAERAMAVSDEREGPQTWAWLRSRSRTKRRGAV